jgi:hypothetical protein
MLLEGKDTELSQRNFLKLSEAEVIGICLCGVLKLDKAYALPKHLPLKKKTGERITIYPTAG